MVASTPTTNGVAPTVAVADSTVANAGEPVTNGTVSSTNGVPLKSLPKGKYTVVGIDIDTTGRRLIDEIVQLAAFTPNDHFEQYIMPYMNLNPAARQRHQVRVISIGFYRMLKSMQTYKIIKSKSEIAALKDFLDWLEALKAKDATSQGIILVYHEERKFIPYMILESLKKYNLLDRFLVTVKSFANGLSLAKASANEMLQHYTLRKLSKVLSATAKMYESSNGIETENSVSTTNPGDGQIIPKKTPQQQQDRDLFDGNASVRAKLTYEVVLQLSNQQLSKETALESAAAIENMLTAIRPYAQPIDCDLNELHTQNENLERQNSFRPVFLNYFKTTLYHRVRAVKFRIILAEQGYDLQTLNAIWGEKQRDGIVEVLQVIDELKPEDRSELADLLDSFFDPAKTTIKPIIKSNNRRRNRPRGGRNNVKNEGNNNIRPTGTEQGAGGDKQGAAGPLPESTPESAAQAVTTNGSLNGAKPQRGKRNQRSRNNSVKSSMPPTNFAGAADPGNEASAMATN